MVILGSTTGLLLLGAIPVTQFAVGQLSKPTPEENTPEANILPVETLTAEPVTGYEVSRTYTGEVAALRSSDVGFERSGQLVSVLVESGDRVTAGQPLARLDTQNLQTQRQQLLAEKSRAMAQLAELQAGPRQEDIAAARAEVQNIQEQLRLKQAQRSRREYLYNEGAISQEELDEFTYSENALEARLNKAQSNLAKLRNGTRPEQITAQEARIQQINANIADLDVTISKSTLKAPFAAIISDRQVDEGTVVSAGQPVVSLVENATPEIRVGIPAKVAQKMRVGQTQTVQLGEQNYNATISAILPEIDPETRTQTVVLDLKQAALRHINPGQTARIEITERITQNGYWLPTSALTEGVRGLWTCYILTPSPENPEVYQLQQQSVEIIHEQGDRVLVQGTIQPGDQLVATGVHRLVPSQKVRPVAATINN
ncbi:MAG: efflux RND transporter periplasmic adaptor subunit [Kamptonema sp. SIO4C4]|nr:efflux RND transporter periplasmic adaptor subunit [Kamptonema sp. SIO4C4]